MYSRLSFVFKRLISVKIYSAGERNATEQCTEVYALNAVHSYELPGIIY
jgi:hypothetical protein